MTCTIISTREELNIKCKNEFEPPYPEIKAKLRDMVWELFCKGYNRFWVNCEYGVPLWCAEIIAALKMYNDVELCITMPFEGQATNWGEEHRERFFNLHADSDEVKIISKSYEEHCYMLADEHMIDNSDLLIVVGSNLNCYGAGYAKSQDVDVIREDILES